MPTADGDSTTRPTVVEVASDDRARVLEAFALLNEELGPGRVEDRASFLATVSEATDTAVVPRTVAAVADGRLHGAVLGVYLANVNVGMVLYSAVSPSYRGNGLYLAMRERLAGLLNREASRINGPGRPAVDYVVSELEEGSPLLRTYVRRWASFVAPCEYRQPAAQGLSERRLRLVFQPVGAGSRPTRRFIVEVVREVYRGVYRLDQVERDGALRSVVQSLGVSEAPAALGP